MSDTPPKDAEIILKTAIACLVPGEAEPVALPPESAQKLLVIVTALEEPLLLADAAERLLKLAASIDENRKSPRAADTLSALALAAAERSIALQSENTGAVDHAVDVGRRYKAFKAEHDRFENRDQEPPSGAIRASSLTPKKRV